MGEAGGIIKAESAIYACKVQVVCPRCGKPTRVGHKILGGRHERAHLQKVRRVAVREE